MELIRWAAQRLGGAIIIIEHDMSLVKELAQIVYVLHNGALLAQGQRRRDPGRSGRARGLCRRRKVSRPRLAFENLTGGYGSTTIVRDLAGAAVAGEVLCVLGRNGVGKTTLMKLLTGYLPCTRGRVLLDDAPITALDPAARRRAGISYCPQERPVFDDLSVRDNLTLMRDEPQARAVRAAISIAFRSSERRLAQHAGTLSGGEKKMLSFVRGLAEDQPVILLDEPSEGVQWENILHMEALIAEKKCGRRRVHRGRAKSRLRRAHRRPLSDHGPGPRHAGRLALRDRAQRRASTSARLNELLPIRKID